ncbi:MAG: sporulation protein YunB [Oscillospiraceae bacterium]
MRYTKDRVINSVSYILFIITAAAAILCAVVYIQMVKHMEEICEYKGRQTANSLVGEAIDDELKKMSGEYLDIKYSSDGRISSIKADTYKINALENDLKNCINDKLSHIEDNEMGVPLGTLTGITCLSGRGAEVKIKLHQVGAVDAKIISEFSSAGINQTKHSLKVEVTTELSAILPGHSTDISMTDEYILGETIIVGELPKGMILGGTDI